jgi:hypothetical protein
MLRIASAALLTALELPVSLRDVDLSTAMVITIEPGTSLLDATGILFAETLHRHQESATSTSATSTSADLASADVASSEPSLGDLMQQLQQIQTVVQEHASIANEIRGIGERIGERIAQAAEGQRARRPDAAGSSFRAVKSAAAGVAGRMKRARSALDR